jgi:hypothetical protein
MSIAERLRDPKGVAKDRGDLFATCQEKISSTMTKLFRKSSNGGNPFLFAYTAPKPHELVSPRQPLMGRSSIGISIS